MLIEYVPKRFNREHLAVIENANAIIEEYQSQGYDLTLRQIYYQFVSRDLIKENSQKEYKKLGSIINDARLAGLISWTAIVDRTRNLKSNSHWSGPAEIIESCADQFQIDKWENQPYRVEVWIEKDALVGVVDRVCRQLDVPYFSCRGYTSQSEMWVAGQRLMRYAEVDPNRKIRGGSAYQTPVIIHLGDHDPSGIDMSRDIEDRLHLFTGLSQDDLVFKRIALNMNQIREYDPPPNPAKITDSRAREYIKLHGDESWELDALDPKVITQLIESTVLSFRDEKKWAASLKEENGHKKTLNRVAEELT